MLHVALHGLFADKENRGDVAVAVTTGDLLKHFDFTATESVMIYVLSELDGDLGRYMTLAFMHLADGFYQFPARHALEHVALGASLQSATNISIAIECSEDNDARILEFAANGAQRFDAADVREGASP